MRTDSERLDWFEERTHEGGCPSLVFNDNGWWAVGTDGAQSLDFEDPPTEPFAISWYFEDASMWRKTVREAIDAAMDEEAS